MLNRGDYIKAKEFIEMIGDDGLRDCIVESEIVLIKEEPCKDTFILSHIQRRGTKYPITSRIKRHFLDDKFEVCDRPLTRDEERYKFKLLEYLSKKLELNEVELEIKGYDRWCDGVKNILEDIIADVENNEFMKN